MATAVVDLDVIAPDIAPELESGVNDVLEQNLAPDIKTKLLVILLIGVGLHFKKKLFGDASKIMDSDIDGGELTDEENAQAERLAIKLQRNYALQRDTMPELIETYLNSLLGEAKAEAFANAKSLGKHPTLTRSMVGETCQWCLNRVGTFTDPSHDLFKRHGGCDCKLETSGYNTRNGVVSNYVKRKAKA